MDFKAVLQKLLNEGISFLFFLGGIAVGIVIALAAFSLVKKIKGKREGGKAFPFGLKEEMREEFKAKNTGLDFKAKLSALSESVKNAAERVAESDGKSREIFGLSVPLGFTAYEFLDFLSELSDGVQKDLEKALSSAKFTVLFYAYKLSDGKIAKDPKEVKFSYVYKVITDEKPEKKGAAKIIGKAVAPIKKLAFKAVKPTVVSLVDGFFLSVSDTFADCLAVLFGSSGEEKEAV